MTNDLVPVPASLLLTPDLPASAKLIWMVARLATAPAGVAWLSAASGLSCPTVRTALARLTAAGWTPSEAPGDTVTVPAALLTNHRLHPHARVLYGLLLLVPGKDFTHLELANLAHAAPNTIARAIDELARAEWITVERANRLARIHLEFTSPGMARGMLALDRAQWRLNKAEFFGEALMREYLSLLIDSDQYEDNAAPGFLVNPRTEERLQFDRFYPPTVAFEYNGPQHDRPTERFSPEQSAAQRERDLIKLGICAYRGITLVTVHHDDLTLTAMQQKIPPLLPRRDLTGYELLSDFLEMESHRYRRRAATI